MTRGTEFFPSTDEGKIYVSFELSPIATIEQTNSIAKRIENDVLKKYTKLKIIKHYITTIGKSSTSAGSKISLSGDATGTITVEMFQLNERKNYPINRMLGIIRNYTKNIAGVKFTVEVKKAGPPTDSPVNVVVRGQDIRILKQISRNIQSLIRTKIRGAVDISDNYGVGVPQVMVTINREKANMHGVSVNEIATSLSTLYNGMEVSNHYFGDKEVKIRVKLDDKYRNSFENMNKIYFYKTSGNTMLELGELVNVNMEPSLTVISREDMSRAITISGNNYGRTSTEVMDDVKKLLNNYPLPPGYLILFRGENEERDESFSSLKIAFLAAFILMYFIITLQLGSFSQPLSIMITILLSIFGVGLGLLISGSKVGMMAMFGFVSLAGVVVNDAIVLITYINQLRKRGMSRSEAIIKAGNTRMRPIMMTTITTVAGMLPLAIGVGSDPGSNAFWSPMAWVLMTGLTVATLQTLIVVPIIYSFVEDFNAFMIKNIRRIISFAGNLLIRIVEKITKSKAVIENIPPREKTIFDEIESGHGDNDESDFHQHDENKDKQVSIIEV
jgi:HAE1 family hydrophobic/amphiphilic exporter-1